MTSTKISRVVMSNFGKLTVSVDTNLFASMEEIAPASRAKNDKKYNLRVRQEDLYLLDALAEAKSVPRSIVLNQLLHQILLDDLMDIPELDVRLLLAETADHRSQLDSMNQPWAFDALQTENENIMSNVRCYNQAVLEFQEDPNAPEDYSWNSRLFHDVKKHLEEMEK